MPGEGAPEERSTEDAVAAATAKIVASEGGEVERNIRVTASNGDVIGMAANQAEARRMIEETREGLR